MDDEQLINDTLAGKSAAFGQLVLKYQDRLYNSVLHVSGSVEDARDAVQDAFVQAFVRLETFQRTARFYTWLYRIAFNQAVSRRRKQRPTESIDGRRDACGAEPVDPSAGPTARLEGDERALQVRGALAALSEEHRSILVLREIEGCDYTDIAEILDLPVGTVRSRLHRARMQLRDQLKETINVDSE